MNKIDEYLNTLDKKNIILLYASIIIAAFIVFYNFNYNVLYEKIKNYDQEINTLQEKLHKTNKLKATLVKLKKEIKVLKSKNLSLNEDLKYLNVLIKTSSILHINEKEFLNILKNVLQKAVENKIPASYAIAEKTDEYKKYIINIDGLFESKNFKAFYKFINNLENIKAVKKIENLKFEKKEQIHFNLRIIFWSLL
ncbi:hypothetical protein JCM15786_06700 [Nautilia lithotrophica]